MDVIWLLCDICVVMFLGIKIVEGILSVVLLDLEVICVYLGDDDV